MILDINSREKVLADYTVRITHTSRGLGFNLHGIKDNEYSRNAAADSLEAIAWHLRGGGGGKTNNA